MRLNTIIFFSEWKCREGMLPCRKVFVAWYRVIDETEDGTFYPDEFSSHLQVVCEPSSEERNDRMSLIHGHYFRDAGEAFRDYERREF